MPRFEIPDGWCVQAFRFTLDPTEAQAANLARHFDSAPWGGGLRIGVGARVVINESW